MKKIKIIAVIATFLAILTLSGCFVPVIRSNKNNEQTSSTNKTVSMEESQSESPEETGTPEQKVIGFGETIIFNEWEVTIDLAEVKESIPISKYTEYNPDEGNVYIAVSATIKNIDTNSATFLPTYSFGNDIRAKLVYGDYEFSSSVLLSYSDDLHSTHLNPLSSKSGVIAFSVTKEIADPNNFNLVLFDSTKSYTFSLNNEIQSV